ncbi:MAG: universal stress protein [Candidatus Acidiferrales bacterium]
MKTTQRVRVLCPIDFDVNSLAALDLARDLVRENGGTLYVLHVVRPPNPVVIPAPMLLERASHFARIRLDEVALESLGDIDHRLLLRAGRPAQQIINAIREFDAHMVVMATHGRSGVPRFFLGSVAESVIRESPCPVLTNRGVAKIRSERGETQPETVGS